MKFELVKWYMCIRLALASFGMEKMTIGSNKIVVFQMAKLGDMVCTTPLFRAIRTSFPNAEITVVGNTINRAIVEGSTDVDTYIAFTNISDMIAEIRSHSFDTCIITGPDIVSLYIAQRAGIPTVIVPSIQKGLSPNADIRYRIASKSACTVSYTEGAYMPGQYLRLLEPLGVTSSDTTKHLRYSPEAERSASTLMQGLGIKDSLVVGLTPVAGNKIKEWPPERFAKIAEYLRNVYGAHVLILGTKADESTIVRMQSALQSQEKIHFLHGQVSIDELKALIATINLFVASDTGPIYIAEAFGIPTIDIVGPVDEREQPPRGEFHRVVVPKRASAVLTVMNAKRYNVTEARRQAEATTVAEVCAEIDSLMYKLSYAKIGS